MFQNLFDYDGLSEIFALDSLAESILSDILLYFGITLPFFLIFWVWYKKEFQPRRIQQKQRSDRQQWWREIRQSMLSIGIFTIIDIGAYIAEQHGLTFTANCDQTNYSKVRH